MSTLRVADLCAPINTPSWCNPSSTQTPKLIVDPMSGGASSGKRYGSGKEKVGRKGDPIIWDGLLRPDLFSEPVFEFPPQHKSEFTNETPLRQYDDRKEP